jgi:hypothetical protein
MQEVMLDSASSMGAEVLRGAVVHEVKPGQLLVAPIEEGKFPTRADRPYDYRR